MTESELNRRAFTKLTIAAFGGIVAGSVAGCGSDKPAGSPVAPEVPTAAAPAGGSVVVASVAEVHLCRGLNTCKGKGADQANACAGQGVCATVKEHSCGGQNDCKGLGGCGADAGANECKGKGGCHVPLMEDAWTKVRGTLEAKLKAAGKPVGAAPPAKQEAE